MFIAPIQPLKGLDEIKGAGALGSMSGNSSATGGVSNVFSDFLRDSIRNVVETDAIVKADTIALATGQTDDLHTLGIDQTKAQLSIDLLVQIRNRLLESYNEIMRINL